jgi:signal transduction histidine kinase
LVYQESRELEGVLYYAILERTGYVRKFLFFSTVIDPMRINLLSPDNDLHKMCREILGQLPGRGGHALVAAGEGDTGPADLYIWDVQADTVFPKSLHRDLSKYLFLLDRKDVSGFRESLGQLEANILLKPLTRPTLAAFLGLVVAAYEDRVATASSLRADRDDILQCLIQTNLKLQEFDQDRTNFLARALHDFRAPLTAISGYCGLLLNEALGALNEEQREVLQRMQHSTKRLSRMTSAMFQLSVGRRVKRRPNLAEADIRECIEQALHEIAPMADSKAISTSVDLSADTPMLHLEHGLMEQVLINLLDNACKFTPKGGRIEIRGYPYFWERRSVSTSMAVDAERRRKESRQPNAYRVDILDSGPPVPPEHLENIFEEYTSYSGGQDRSGGGLGLAICRMIVAQHEGYVWAENTSAGPTFSILLPIPSGFNNQNKTAAHKLLEFSEA